MPRPFSILGAHTIILSKDIHKVKKTDLCVVRIFMYQLLGNLKIILTPFVVFFREMKIFPNADRALGSNEIAIIALHIF